uniref:Replicative DNA helicase n=1 Tax=Astrosyne radiata TaxID=1158023 RepID=A0A2U9NT79_9STRA|nr:DNA replication helicase [Astrosyne radiata]AWT40298.1 DNA replication helicase [Astrosyne radiata]
MKNFKTHNKILQNNFYLPHSFFIEKTLLTCFLKSPKALNIAVQKINIDYFYFKNHQELFKIMSFMSENDQPIDIVTLVTFIQDNGLMKKIGGIHVLIELLNQLPNLTYVDEYLKLLKDKFLRRSIIKLAYKVINSSYITNIALENILNDFENDILKLTSKFQENKISNISDITYQLLLNIKKKSHTPSLSGLKSGFFNLDSLTQGFQKSDLIIIAGRPSIGKTAFCLSVIVNILKYSKLPVLFFSLEMVKEQIIYRLLSMEANISQSRLYNGQLYYKDWVKLNRIVKIFAKLPLFIDDNFNLSMTNIRTKIKTFFIENNKLGLVVIDYLQLMHNDKSKKDTRAQELSEITRALKNIAREFKIPVIALSQLSRNIEVRANKKPILSDLRESGSIEQDADLVLFLYNNNNEKNITTTTTSTNKIIIDLMIAKQRNGPIGTIQLYFNKTRVKYQNIIR